MAIKPIRERVIKFFVDVYEEYFEIHFGEEESWDLPERTEPMVRYTLTELPEGYVEAAYIESDHLLWTEWQNEKDNKITLQQESGTNEITVDHVGKNLDQINHKDMEIVCQENTTSRCYIWRQENYVFFLTTYEKIPVDDVLLMIDSLTTVNNNK